MKVLVAIIIMVISSLATGKELSLNIYASNYCARLILPANPSPQLVESNYCGYKVGFKRSENYIPREIGLSSEENVAGNILWKKDQLKQACLNGEKESLEILNKKFPAYVIDCNKYKDFY